MLARLNEIVARALLVIAASAAFLLCFLVCADVIGRVGFGRPVKGTPEMVSFTIVIVCFLQAAYAIRSGGMIRVDAFTSLLPPAGQRACEIFGALAGAVFLRWCAGEASSPRRMPGRATSSRAKERCAFRCGQRASSWCWEHSSRR